MNSNERSIDFMLPSGGPVIAMVELLDLDGNQVRTHTGDVPYVTFHPLQPYGRNTSHVSYDSHFLVLADGQVKANLPRLRHTSISDESLESIIRAAATALRISRNLRSDAEARLPGLEPEPEPEPAPEPFYVGETIEDRDRLAQFPYRGKVIQAVDLGEVPHVYRPYEGIDDPGDVWLEYLKGEFVASLSVSDIELPVMVIELPDELEVGDVIENDADLVLLLNLPVGSRILNGGDTETDSTLIRVPGDGWSEVDATDSGTGWPTNMLNTPVTITHIPGK